LVGFLKHHSTRLAEVAAMAAFLVSDKAGAITGTLANATGGTFPSYMYSPECVELEFCELRLNGVLRSSLPARNAQVTAKIAHLSDTPAPLTGVC
jgi:hypothetical protein